jgi:hypothetical protein
MLPRRTNIPPRQVSRKVPLGAQMEKFRCPPLPTPPGSSWRIAGWINDNPQGPKVSQAPKKYCITLRGKDHLKSSWKYGSICLGINIAYALKGKW